MDQTIGDLLSGTLYTGLGKAPGGLKDAVMALNNHRPTVLSNLEIKLEEIIQFLKEEKGVYEGLIAQPKTFSIYRILSGWALG
jgi:hypothetical protein